MDDVDKEDNIEKGDDHMHWKINQHGKDEEKQNINMKDKNQIENGNSKEEEELSAKSGDKVIAFDNEAPIDTILGVDIFPVIHAKTQEKIYVSLEDLEQ